MRKYLISALIPVLAAVSVSCSSYKENPHRVVIRADEYSEESREEYAEKASAEEKSPDIKEESSDKANAISGESSDTGKLFEGKYYLAVSFDYTEWESTNVHILDSELNEVCCIENAYCRPQFVKPDEIISVLNRRETGSGLYNIAKMEWLKIAGVENGEEGERFDLDNGNIVYSFYEKNHYGINNFLLDISEKRFIELPEGYMYTVEDKIWIGAERKNENAVTKYLIFDENGIFLREIEFLEQAQKADVYANIYEYRDNNYAILNYNSGTGNIKPVSKVYSSLGEIIFDTNNLSENFKTDMKQKYGIDIEERGLLISHFYRLNDDIYFIDVNKYEEAYKIIYDASVDKILGIEVKDGADGIKFDKDSNCIVLCRDTSFLAFMYDIETKKSRIAYLNRDYCEDIEGYWNNGSSDYYSYLDEKGTVSIRDKFNKKVLSVYAGDIIGVEEYVKSRGWGHWTEKIGNDIFIVSMHDCDLLISKGKIVDYGYYISGYAAEDEMRRSYICVSKSKDKEHEASFDRYYILDENMDLDERTLESDYRNLELYKDFYSRHRGNYIEFRDYDNNLIKRFLSQHIDE